MRALKLLVFALLMISIISCDKTSTPTEVNVRQQLIGTWLSETDFEKTKTRIVTNLAQDGTFHEIEKAIDLNGITIEASYTGEWSFDGANFKRKYMSKDGRPLPNSKFEYATYAVSVPRIDEFMGLDNIRRRTVKFTRTSVVARP